MLLYYMIGVGGGGCVHAVLSAVQLHWIVQLLPIHIQSKLTTYTGLKIEIICVKSYSKVYKCKCVIILHVQTYMMWFVY